MDQREIHLRLYENAFFFEGGEDDNVMIILKFVDFIRGDVSKVSF